VVPGENAEDNSSLRDVWWTVRLACSVIGLENGQEVELSILCPDENPEKEEWEFGEEWHQCVIRFD
jgi:hypothetical protein